MGCKRRISEWAAAPFLKTYRRRLGTETPWSIPWSVWRAVPQRMRHWLKYRVLDQGDEIARRLVSEHSELRRFPDNRHNGFAITPAAMLHLWKWVHTQRPQRILEFGSGLSTRIFAAYAASQQPAREVSVFTVEHDAAWLDDVRRSLEADGSDACVRLVHAPLSSWTWRDSAFTCYDIPAEPIRESAGPDGFDMCFIDGPPRTIGRFGCFPLAAPYLANDSVVLLDDCLRCEEDMVLQRLRATMKDRFAPPRVLLLDSRGMAEIDHRSGSHHSGEWDAPRPASPKERVSSGERNTPERTVHSTSTETDTNQGPVAVGSLKGGRA